MLDSHCANYTRHFPSTRYRCNAELWLRLVAQKSQTRVRLTRTLANCVVIRNVYRLDKIPLALFYASVSKIFILFLVLIWKQEYDEEPNNTIVPSWTASIVSSLPAFAQLKLADMFRMDWRTAAVRNALSGLSAIVSISGVLIDSRSGSAESLIIYA